MCNDCQHKIASPCHDLSKDDCFKLNETKCDVGCEDVVSTNCVMHEVSVNSKLPNIGVIRSASLNYVLKRIDDAIGLGFNVDWKNFNFNGLDTIKIVNIKQFVDVVTKKINSLGLDNEDLATNIEDVINTLQALDDKFDTLNKLDVANSKMNINRTDSTDVVIKKMITYVNTLQSGTQRQNHVDSYSINYSEDGNSVSADVKVSSDEGNLLVLQEDGLYVGPTSVSTTLNSIKGNPELLNVFTALVKAALPSFKFDIMAQVNTTINYTNSLGKAVKDTAQAGVLLQLKDVRSIETTPSSKLTITFKGI